MGNLRDTWNKGKKKKDDGGPPASDKQRRFLSDLFNRALERGIITEAQFELAMKVISVIRVGPATEIISELVAIKDRGWSGKAVRLAQTLREKYGDDDDGPDDPEEDDTYPDDSEPGTPCHEVHLGEDRSALVSQGLTDSEANDLCERLMADPDFAEWNLSVWYCPPGRSCDRTRLIVGQE